MTQRELFSEPTTDEELGTCPACKHTDTIEGFDGLGTCDDQVFCVMCHTEFNFDTKRKHDHRLKCCRDYQTRESTDERKGREYVEMCDRMRESEARHG